MSKLSDEKKLKLREKMEELKERKIPTPKSLVTSVLFHGSQNLVFLGTNKGVYRSRNGGLSWQLASKGLSGASVKNLERAGTGILCGTGAGLFHSDDLGETWSVSQGVFPTEIVSVKVNPSSNTEVVAADLLGGYFYASQDGGLSWKVVALGPVLPRISSFAYTSSGELLAGTFTEGVIKIASPQMAYWEE